MKAVLVVLFACSLILIFLAFPYLSSADPLDNWHLRNPLPQGNQFNGVTYGNGIFVAVGGAGTIVTSPDGMTWATQPSRTSNHLSGVTCGGGKYVAVGDAGIILTSLDGATWITQSSGTSNDLYGVTYGNGEFVAVGYSGTILTSPDGMTWTLQSFGTSYSLYGVTFGNREFVAVGGTGMILTSPDGFTWTFRSATANSLLAVTYTNGKFVAVGRETIMSSSDGITWTQRSSGAYELSGVTCGNGKFVAVGRLYGPEVDPLQGAILTSPDGITWTTQASGTSYFLNAAAYGNGEFVAVGRLGTILTSPDGMTWTPRLSGTSSNTLDGVTYENGEFVAVASLYGPEGLQGTILTSPDGTTWTTQASGTSYFPDFLNAVAYGNGEFLAVGHAGMVLTSPNGIVWTMQSRAPGVLNAVTYGNGQFVGVGPSSVCVTATCPPLLGGILTSPDGVTWTLQYTAEWLVLNGVTYGNGEFVAVGYSGTILTSPDGVTWTSSSWPLGLSLTGVTYGGGEFVAVGDAGIILTSLDGATWITQSSGTSNDLYGVTYGNGEFVAVGYSGTILTSPDGMTWTLRLSVTSSSTLYGVTYGNGTFVAVGDDGTILQSDPTFFTITVTAGEHGGITPSGTATVNYGGSQTFTITPDMGYKVADVLVDGVSVGPATTYTFNNVTADHTISATFTVSTFTVTASTGEHGSITPAGTTTVNYRSNQTFTITPDTGYEVADVLVDGVSVGPASTYTFNNVTADHTISATFTILTFTVTTSGGEHGNISPDGPQTVNYNATTSFTVTPDAGYGIASVNGCGGTLSGNVYTTGPVTADCAVSVTFGLAYKISGTVKNVNGVPMQGVTMTLNGGAIGTIATTTDSSGNYKFKGLVNGTYTITPAKAGYAFTKPSKTATINGATVKNKNFIGSPVVISGTVTNSDGKPMPNVIVTLSGVGTSSTGTDINGKYKFKPVPNGTYTITPGKAGRSFEPSAEQVEVNGASMTGQNFVGSKTTSTN